MTRRRLVLGAASAGALALVALAWAIGGSLRGTAVLLVLMVCLVGGGLAVLILRSEQRVVTRLRRVERRLEGLVDGVATNHRRAAAWNFHLRNDLGLPGSVPPGDPPAPAATDSDAGADGVPPASSDLSPRRAEHRRPGPTDQPAEIRSGRVTVVVHGPTPAVVRDSVDSVLADEESQRDLDLEVLVAASDATLDDDRVRWLAAARGSEADVRNDGLHAATGSICVFLGSGAQPRPGALQALVDAFDVPGTLFAQPVVLDADGLIRTVGCHFAARGALPAPLLAGLPASDAERLSGLRLPAADGAVLALRTGAARDAGGFDASLGGRWSVVDLCLRARKARGDVVAAAPDAVVDQPVDDDEDREPHRRAFLERWARDLPEPSGLACEVAGLTTAHIATDGRHVAAPMPLLVRDRRDARTRWGIKVASPPGRHGARWGDTHFAKALRVALERQGQVAVVHPWGSHDAPAAGLDDVHLVLRGKHRVRPVPGKVNVLWVISHPESVTVDELLGFDTVFAASHAWAREMTRVSGRDVGILLQATDATAFGPDGPVVHHDAPLFVGGVHPGRERSVVGAALAGGVSLAVYGPGWDGNLPEGYLRGDYVEPSALPAYYRGAPRVLADHWPSMADHGFVQNRVFDAVASGAPVISDPVADIDEVFGGAVLTYRGPDELAELCGRDGESAFLSASEREWLARRTRREHSFDARASRLVDVVPIPGGVR